MNEPLNIGKLLQEKREAKGLSLENVSHQTRISLKYLRALEEESFSDFPAEVYLLGFLRNYARFLAVDSVPLLLAYKSRGVGVEKPRTPLQTITPGHPAAQVPIDPMRTHVPIFKKKRQMSHWGWSLGLLTMMAIAGTMLWFLIKTPLAPAPAPKGSGGVETVHLLEAQAAESVWLRVSADGEMIFMGILSAGQSRSWQAKDSFQVKIGYIPGIRLKLNNQPVDLSRLTGEVAEITLPQKP